MAIDWERLGRELAREAREYLADIRNILEALRRVEGWITLGLILAVLFMAAVWFITGLGFDRLNDIAISFRVWRPVHCKPLTDLNAMVVVLNALVLGLLALTALGEMMELLDRMRHGLPKEPRRVAYPAFSMLIVGSAGIAFMRYIC